MSNGEDLAHIRTVPPPTRADFVHAHPSLHPDIHDDLTSTLMTAFDHSQIGLAMVNIAASQIGVAATDTTGGIPLERYVRTFWPDSEAQPWSAFFVSWCYQQAVNRTPPWSNPGLVDSVHEWAASSSRLVRNPVRGDLFGIGSTHMGIVTRCLKDTILTVEGNAINGHVMANERSLPELWFARI